MALSQAQYQVIIDVFDGELVMTLFLDQSGVLTKIAETAQAAPLTHSKTAYTEVLRRSFDICKSSTAVSRVSVLVSVHATMRQAHYVYDHVDFEQETMITPSIVKDFVSGVKSKYASATTVFDIEVNGYSTRKPFGKMGTSLGGFIARYDDTDKVSVITEAVTHVFSVDPTVTFFIERIVSVLPHSLVPYTLFVLGATESEYCVVREGIVREVVPFAWGTDDLKTAPLQTQGNQMPQEYVENFWGAISKSKSSLPMPQSYSVIAYGTDHAQAVIEALMSGVYTATGAAMKQQSGELADTISRRFQSHEMRARALYEAIRIFSFPL